MNDIEALIEARRRWPGQGAWVKQEGEWCSVGVLRDGSPTAQRFQMGRAGSWDGAFRMADKVFQNETLPRIRTTPREGGPWPIAGDLFEEEDRQ